MLKDELSNARNDYEDVCLRRLAEVLPDDVKVTILAGFADTKLFGFLAELRFAYVIRLKGNTKVSAADGPTRPASEWVGQGGRVRKLRDATVSEAQRPVGAVVCVHAKAMKEPWCLVASDGSATAPQIITLYAKRWKVEPSFRDTKDLGALPRGKKTPLGDEEAIGSDAQGGMMMKAAPALALIVTEPDLLFQFLIVALDPSAALGMAHQIGQRRVGRQSG